MTTVTTVTGPIDSAELGLTLTHEHIVNDVTSWHHRTCSHGWDPDDFATRPVTEGLLWDLRHDPFGNLDNCRLDDEKTAVAELARFATFGGRTVLDATGLGIGRDLAAQVRISRATGVQIIAGTGYYLEASQPDDVRGAAPESIAERIVADVTDGVLTADGERIRPGMIGEIGVGADFTPAERNSLIGACVAQIELRLPMQVHLPGWLRRAEEVLDVVEEHGVDPAVVILCHMGPSGEDLAYQERVLARGAYLGYDMLGMEVFYADQGVQCPSDEQNARHIARLIERGHAARVLMSQDIFIKSLLRVHGGPGYAHILQYFVPRLLAVGIGPDVIEQLMVGNPQALFERAAGMAGEGNEIR
jgi:phosphotriesterase-related protein